MSVSVPAKNPVLLHIDQFCLNQRGKITDSVIKKNILELKLKLQKYNINICRAVNHTGNHHSTPHAPETTPVKHRNIGNLMVPTIPRIR